MLKLGTLSLFCGIPQELNFSGNVKIEKRAHKIILFGEKNRKIQIILDIENCF